jgi:hypothetical protein
MAGPKGAEWGGRVSKTEAHFRQILTKLSAKLSERRRLAKLPEPREPVQSSRSGFEVKWDVAASAEKTCDMQRKKRH